jgi:hypothetical protein
LVVLLALLVFLRCLHRFIRWVEKGCIRKFPRELPIPLGDCLWGIDISSEREAWV